MKKTKLLIAAGIYPPDIGGPATYVSTIRRELPAHGFEIKIVTYADDDAQNGGEIYRVKREGSAWQRHAAYYRQISKLLDWADIVYIQGPVSAGLPTAWACKKRRKPYFLKVVGDYAWEQGRQRFGISESLDDFLKKRHGFRVGMIRFIQRRVARGASAVITPSKYLKKVVSQWGVAEDRITVINNAVPKLNKDMDRQDIKIRFGLNGDTIITVGRLVPWKGFEALIELMPELLEVNPHYKLVIVGSGPLKDKLSELIGRLNLKRKVILAGPLPQKLLWEFMYASGTFVLNTSYEGFPHLIVEAMRLKLPVISTRVGGNPEVVEHRKSGLLVEYNNKEELKEAIIKVYEDGELRDRLVHYGALKAKEFTRERMIEELIQVFNAKYGK